MPIALHCDLVFTNEKRTNATALRMTIEKRFAMLYYPIYSCLPSWWQIAIITHPRDAIQTILTLIMHFAIPIVFAPHCGVLHLLQVVDPNQNGRSNDSYMEISLQFYANHRTFNIGLGFSMFIMWFCFGRQLNAFVNWRCFENRFQSKSK